MNYNHYPQYKDSGIEWLGEIPKGWIVSKLKHIASVKFSNVDKKITEGQQLVRVCNYMDVYYNDFITSDLKLMMASASTEEITRFSLKEGDVLITKDSESWDDIAVPAYVSLDLAGVVCGYHLAQVRPKTSLVDGKYLFRSFCFQGINYQYKVEATGITRYGLGKYWLDNSLFLLPTKEEQHAIAAFLDQETSRIDMLIEKKEKQIELLKEKRAALISHAVTKGLDPNVKMKDSGIDWLGEIPEGWETKKYKRISLRVDVGIAEAATHAYADNGVPIIRSTNIRPGIINTENLLYIQKWFADKNKSKYLRENDLITVRTGAPGTTAIVPKELNNSQCFTLLISTLLSDHNPKFFCYLLNSVVSQHYFRVEGWGTAQINISVPILQDHYIVVPPHKEQNAIVTFLDLETTKIDALIEKVQKSIELLKEYRTAIISAAVTGKIDVRGMV